MTHLDIAHPDFVSGAALHLDLLNDSRLHAGALRLGEQYLARVRAHDAPAFRIELALARCLAQLGQHERAETYYAEAIQALQQNEVEGIWLGYAFETGARLAIERKDEAAFHERASACAQCYALEQNSALAHANAKLQRDARRAGLLAAEAAPDIDADTQTVSAITHDEAFYARVLELLVHSAHAHGGCLYVSGPSGVRRVASTVQVSAANWQTIDLAAQSEYASACNTSDITVSMYIADYTVKTSLQVPEAGLALWPCVLSCARTSGDEIVGVAYLSWARHSDAPGLPANRGVLAELLAARSERNAQLPV